MTHYISHVWADNTIRQEQFRKIKWNFRRANEPLKNFDRMEKYRERLRLAILQVGIVFHDVPTVERQDRSTFIRLWRIVNEQWLRHWQ